MGGSATKPKLPVLLTASQKHTARKQSVTAGALQLSDTDFWQRIALSANEIEGIEGAPPGADELVSRVEVPETAYEEEMAGGICRHCTLSLRGFYPGKPSKPNQDASLVVGGLEEGAMKVIALNRDWKY